MIGESALAVRPVLTRPEPAGLQILISSRFLHAGRYSPRLKTSLND
jgi:hypothetical protein